MTNDNNDSYHNKHSHGGTLIHYFINTFLVLTGSSLYRVQKLSFKEHCQVVHRVLFGGLKEMQPCTQWPRYTLHTAYVSSRCRPRVLILNLHCFQHYQSFKESLKMQREKPTRTTSHSTAFCSELHIKIIILPLKPKTLYLHQAMKNNNLSLSMTTIGNNIGI